MSGKIPNSDVMADPFPGVSWGFTNALGSQGASGSGEDALPLEGWSGTPGGGTTLMLQEQADPSEGSSTLTPGQNDGFQGGNEPGYVNTGAGHGSASHYPRRTDQAPDGEA